MKLRLRLLYELREEYGLRLLFTVHDEVCFEVDADCPNEKLLTLFGESYHIKLSVPVTWDINSGRHWAECE